MSERRNDERLGIRLEVEVQHETDTAAMHTRDISTTGVFIECNAENPPPVGTILRIRVKTPLAEGEAPIVRAQVVRVDKDGIALKFLDS